MQVDADEDGLVVFDPSAIPSGSYEVPQAVLDWLLDREHEPASPAWVSVEERLPERGVWVLVVYRGHVQCMAYRWTGEVWESPNDDADPAEREDFTHWAPLPSPL